MKKLASILGVVTATALSMACAEEPLVGAGNETDRVEPSNQTQGVASARDVSACKEGCDKMKFFGCISAQGLTDCYADCDSATSKQIETFVACAQNSTCDAECRTSLTASGGGDDGASSASCTEGCNKLVACDLIRVGDKAQCMSVCQKDAYQSQIDCVKTSSCQAIAKGTCGSFLESDSSGSD